MHATDLQSADEISTLRVHDSGSPEGRLAQFKSGLPQEKCGVLYTALPLVAADLLAVLVTFTLVWKFMGLVSPLTDLEWAPLAAGFGCAVIVTNLAVGLYPGIALSSVSEVRLAVSSTALVGLIFLIVSSMQSWVDLSMQFLVVTTTVSLCLAVPVARMAARRWFSRYDWWGQPALVLGDEAAAATYSFIHDHPNFGLRPVGIVGDWQPTDDEASAHWLGTLSDAAALLKELDDPWLIVSMPQRTHEEIQELVRTFGPPGTYKTLIADLDHSPSLLNRAGSCLEWECHANRSAPIHRLAKRLLDIALTVTGGIVLLPFMLLLAGLVKLTSSGPALYSQERIGRDGRTFKAWKFRSMVADADRVLNDYLAADPQRQEEWARNHKLQRDPRITLIGRLLRKTSLDELPQLWNVLMGEMSLVGPRPIVAAEKAKYGSTFGPYCSVPPGITGLWQVSGRNDTTYAERVELDGYYTGNWSFWLDLYILILTIKVVLFRQGAY